MGASFARRDISEGFWNRRNSFNYASRGHKSVTLDLRSEWAASCSSTSCAFPTPYIENNAAGVVDRLFGGWAALSELNPRLVMASFPGFGLSGRTATSRATARRWRPSPATRCCAATAASRPPR